jgi:RecB family exonuclease
MIIPDDFAFSQQNLQDYLDCPRRFYLRYVEQLDWPAVESEPVLEQEHLAALGNQFHLLVQQALTGVPAEVIRDSIQEEDLARWWRNFEALDLNLSNRKSLVEEPLSVPLAGFRLIAKPDLILVNLDHSILVYDWKTSRHEPNAIRLSRRVQTMVYPYVITRCSPVFMERAEADPEALTMIYWYPEFPQLQVTFEYSSGKYSSGEQTLVNLIGEISSLSHQEEFPKTADEKLCRFCRYRSLCERGGTAGVDTNADPVKEEGNVFEIDFDSL